MDQFANTESPRFVSQYAFLFSIADFKKYSGKDWLAPSRSATNPSSPSCKSFNWPTNVIARCFQ